METISMNGRINYIDSAKGACMFLVVMVHTGVPEPLPNIYELDVPAFFVLSGYFFNTGGRLRDFLRKKSYRLILPFLLFYLLSYAVYYALLLLYPPVATMTEASGILDCLTQKAWFNGPLWFLPCLFWIQLLTFLLARLPGGIVAELTASLALAAVGLLLGRYSVFLPLAFDTALTSLPYFLAGRVFRQTSIFNAGHNVTIIISLATILLWGFSGDFSIGLSTNSYDVNLLVMYLLPCLFVLMLTLLAKHLLQPWERLLPFIGRHTIFVLCTHHLVYRPVKLVLSHFVGSPEESLLTFFVTMLLCLLAAPLAERHLPWLLGCTRPSDSEHSMLITNNRA